MNHFQVVRVAVQRIEDEAPGMFQELLRVGNYEHGAYSPSFPPLTGDFDSENDHLLQGFQVHTTFWRADFAENIFFHGGSPVFFTLDKTETIQEDISQNEKQLPLTLLL
jgi:hypothetical protein